MFQGVPGCLGVPVFPYSGIPGFSTCSYKEGPGDHDCQLT